MDTQETEVSRKEMHRSFMHVIKLACLICRHTQIFFPLIYSIAQVHRTMVRKYTSAALKCETEEYHLNVKK